MQMAQPSHVRYDGIARHALVAARRGWRCVKRLTFEGLIRRLDRGAAESLRRFPSITLRRVLRHVSANPPITPPTHGVYADNLHNIYNSVPSQKRLWGIKRRTMP